MIFSEPFDQTCKTRIDLQDICRKNTVLFLELKCCLLCRSWKNIRRNDVSTLFCCYPGSAPVSPVWLLSHWNETLYMCTGSLSHFCLPVLHWNQKLACALLLFLWKYLSQGGFSIPLRCMFMNTIVSRFAFSVSRIGNLNNWWSDFYAFLHKTMMFPLRTWLRHFPISCLNNFAVCRLTLPVNCVIVQLCLLYIFTKADTITVPVDFLFVKHALPLL